MPRLTDRAYPVLTPIIADMQQTARELGIVRDLLDVRQHCGYLLDADCRRRFDYALASLGAEPVPSPAPVVGPDPRD